MSRYETVGKIVEAVLKDLADRKGCDIEEIIDDSEIYNELKDDLFDIVDDILCKYLGEIQC